MTAQLTQLEIDQWRDKKRYLWLMGLIAPTALFVMLPLVWAFNQWGWHVAAQVPFWIGPILLYVLLPALDLRFGPDGQNPPDEVMERLENDKYYRYCTYIYIPFQYASVIFGAYLFTASDLSWLGFDGGLGWPAKIGLALSVGVLGGVGINTAHEMGHKKDELERWLSKITLAQTCYGHFYIEHNRGHHVRVATPEDPASARFGETFWEFLPRSVFGSLKSAWELEAKRLDRAGKSHVALVQRRAQRMGDVGGALRRADRGVRPRAHPVRRDLRGVRLHAAGDRQLPGALRAAATEDRQRPLRAVHAGAQLELRPHRDQPVPVPPAAAQRPPRQPDAALPDAAQHGRCAEPAERLRVDDRADVLPAAVAQGDGPPGARPLRRRHHPGEHPSAGARQGARRVRAASPDDAPRRKCE